MDTMHMSAGARRFRENRKRHFVSSGTNTVSKMNGFIPLGWFTMSVRLSPFNLACALVCALWFAQTIDSSADNQPSEQTLDAVCKADSMPAGFVAVGEIESPECKPSAPGRKNAWLIDRVRD